MAIYLPLGDMKSVFASFKNDIILVMIGICWLAALNRLLLLDGQNTVFSDAESYKDAAELLYHHFKFHFYRPMLMPLIMGLPYLFGYSDEAVYQFGFYVNTCCWLGSTLLLYRLLQDVLEKRKALLLTIFCLFTIGSALLVFHLLTESIFTFFMLSGFYFLMRYDKSKNFRDLSLSLSILLLGILIKPGAQFFVWVCLIWHLRIILKNYTNPALLFLAGSFLLIGVQLVQMKKAYGDFTISYISGVTYYNYLGAKSEAMKDGIPFGTEKAKREAYIFTFPVSVQNRIAVKDLKNQLQNNTLNLIKSYFSNVLENTKTPSDCLAMCHNVCNAGNFEKGKQILTTISKWQNRILSVLGFCLAIWCLSRFRNFRGFYLFVSIYILSVMLLSGLSCYQGDRFHVVFYPMVFILAGKIFFKKRGKALNQ